MRNSQKGDLALGGFARGFPRGVRQRKNPDEVSKPTPPTLRRSAAVPTAASPHTCEILTLFGSYRNRTAAEHHLPRDDDLSNAALLSREVVKAGIQADLPHGLKALTFAVDRPATAARLATLDDLLSLPKQAFVTVG